MKERNVASEKTERKESFFDQMQEKKKVNKKRAGKPFDVLERFWAKLNKCN